LESFSSKGFVVYGTSRNPERVLILFFLSALDVRNTESIQAAVAKIIATGRLDID
jgi:hypothetical protein